VKTRFNPFICSLLLSMAAPLAQAAVFYWDGSNATADADGGSGTWDTVTSNWNDAATGGASVTWPATGTDNDAFFGGAAGTVTVAAGGISANDINFPTDGYSIDNGALTLVGTSPTITTLGASTINSAVLGSSGLVKAGEGVLMLNAVNAYTGTTTINGGTVLLGGSSDSLAVTSGLAFGGTGTLNLAGSNQTLASLAFAAGGTYTGTVSNGSLGLASTGNVSLAPTGAGAANATLDLSGLTSFTVSKPLNNLTLGGNGTATTAQTGALKLSAASNSITVVNLQVAANGGTGSIVNSGVLQLGVSNTINATNFQVGSTRSNASVVFQSGLTSPTATLRALTGGSDRMATFLVGVNGAGATGPNTQHADFSLGSIDARITTLTVSQGQSGATTGAPPAVLGNFTMGTGALDATSITISDNAGQGGNQTNTGTFNQRDGTVTVGTLTLGRRFGTNTFTALPRLLPTYNLGTSTSSGVLKIGTIAAGTGVVATTSARTLNINNGTVQAIDSNSDLAINGTGAVGTGNSISITLGTGGIGTFEVPESRTTTLGEFTATSGAGGLNKTGAGTLVMNAANTYTGDTKILAGALIMTNRAGLGGSALDVDASENGTLTFSGTTGVTLGGLKGSRDFSLLNSESAAQPLIIGTTTNNVYTGVLSGLATSLAKVGSGSQTFSGAATYSLSSLQTRGGTLVVTDGTYNVTTGAATAYTVGQNGFTVAGGATFRLNGGTVNATSGNYIFTAGHTTGGSGSFILDSGTFNGGNNEVLNAYGATGTATINGGTLIAGQFRVAQATGTLNLNGGILRINNLSTGGGTSTINFNGGTVEAKQNNVNFLPTTLNNAKIRTGGAVFDTSTFNITIAKDLSEDAAFLGGGLSKLGTGALTLSGANTYTGGTTVSAGSLLVTNTAGSATGTGDVTVTGGLFGGTGSVAGNVLVGGGARLDPGTTTGTLTVAGAVGGAGAVAFQVADFSSDKLVAGGIDPSALTLEVQAAETLTGNAYVLVDSASAVTGPFASVTGIPSGYSLSYSYNDGVDSNNIALVKEGGSSPFQNWAGTTHGLSGAGAEPGADPDSDGLSNLVEFVIGGNPKASGDPLPTAIVSGENMVFTFRRADLALTEPGIATVAEYSTSLDDGWTTAVDGTNSVFILVTNDGFETGVDKVEVSVPRSLTSSGKLFARLKVTIP
jgi:fibronectin-binding autotransporter adhesin